MQINEKTFVVNSPISSLAFNKWNESNYKQYGYSTYTVRHGEQRSLDQNALLHLWLTLYAADLAGVHKKEVKPQMVEFLKNKAKRQFYDETRSEWMVSREVDPATGEEGKPYFVSSADYKVNEMFVFLTWLQSTAINDNVLLESRGQFKALQDKQEAA